MKLNNFNLKINSNNQKNNIKIKMICQSCWKINTLMIIVNIFFLINNNNSKMIQRNINNKIINLNKFYKKKMQKMKNNYLIKKNILNNLNLQKKKT